MRWCSVRLLLVAMLATQHTDFESFANALGAIPNQPPVPMACEPSPSPIDVDTKDIVRQVIDVLLKHSPSPAVHLEVLGRRWLALARNESVTNLTSTLLPAKVPAMKKRDKRAREVLELMPVTPGCPQAIIALLMSQANTHRSAADIKVLRRCGAAAVQLAEAGLKQPTSATSKVVPAETIKALDAHRAAEANAGKTRAWMRAEDVALLELHAGDLPMSTHHAALVNRSRSARQNRMLRLQKDVGGLVRATFSKSITNQAGPLLELHYGRWTRLSNVIAAHISTVLEKRGTITRGRRSHRDRRQASVCSIFCEFILLTSITSRKGKANTRKKDEPLVKPLGMEPYAHGAAQGWTSSPIVSSHRVMANLPFCGPSPSSKRTRTQLPLSFSIVRPETSPPLARK